jgi:hypothetical protein
MLVCRTRVLSFWLGLVAVGLLVASGCQSGGRSGPTGTVKGKVTLAGKPVPTGTMVSFVSDTAGAAAAKVGADGAYELMAAGKTQVPVGKYRVMVTDPPAGTMSQADYDKMMSGGPKEPEAKTPSTVIPAKYTAVGTSGLSYEVKAGPNAIDIELQ